MCILMVCAAVTKMSARGNDEQLTTEHNEIWWHQCMQMQATHDDNLYVVLGVESSESLENIKEAYESLCEQYSPDQHPDDEEIELEYKKVNYAYAILSDTTLREVYDQYGPIGVQIVQFTGKAKGLVKQLLRLGQCLKCLFYCCCICTCGFCCGCCCCCCCDFCCGKYRPPTMEDLRKMGQEAAKKAGSDLKEKYQERKKDEVVTEEPSAQKQPPEQQKSETMPLQDSKQASYGSTENV